MSALFLALFAFSGGSAQADLKSALKLDAKPRSSIQFDRQLNADSQKSCLPSADEVWTFARPGVYKISGFTAFMGVLYLPYAYDITIDEKGAVRLTVRVHFKGDYVKKTPSILDMMKWRLEQAAEAWTKALPEGNKNLSFEFKIEDSAEDAHFSVELIDEKTLGPYNLRWSSNWDSIEVSHELGHMLGLIDEYDLMKELGGEESSQECDAESIMCESNTGSPQLYQAYLAFRRPLCAVK